MVSGQLQGSSTSRKDAILARRPDDVVSQISILPQELAVPQENGLWFENRAIRLTDCLLR